MAHLCQITLPGLDVASEWQLVHDQLLDEFPAVTDVLATTLPGTLLVVHDGPADDGWLDCASDTVLASRRRPRSASGARA